MLASALSANIGPVPRVAFFEAAAERKTAPLRRRRRNRWEIAYRLSLELPSYTPLPSPFRRRLARDPLRPLAPAPRPPAATAPWARCPCSAQGCIGVFEAIRELREWQRIWEHFVPEQAGRDPLRYRSSTVAMPWQHRGRSQCTRQPKESGDRGVLGEAIRLEVQRKGRGKTED